MSSSKPFQSKHRQVGEFQTDPAFRKRVKKSRAKAEAARKARRKNRKK